MERPGSHFCTSSKITFLNLSLSIGLLHYLIRGRLGTETGTVLAMITIVKNLLNRKKKGSDSGEKPVDYDEQRQKMNSSNVNDRLTLAENSRTHKEILYYLAEKDPDPRVREAVARNQSTPLQASGVLSTDQSQDVRLALAGRLMDLLPDLSKDKHSQLYAFAVQALGTLALDEVLKVRVALSSTLKDMAHAPPKVAAQLARDVERDVSEPILRFCAALSDEDLLEILRAHPASWAIEAIASRDELSENVSGAVIEADDRQGGKALIQNQSAIISEIVLHQIVDKARDYPEWQEPIAGRKSLPVSVAKELASFVDASVRELLTERDDFDPEAAEEIAAVFRRRMEFASEDEGTAESATERAQKAYKDGRLGEEMISDAVAMRDRDFLYAAIAKLIRVHPQVIEKIFEMQSPKSIVALCWHADLSMRLALQMQKDIGQILPKDLIYPRDGTDYPFTDEEMDWQVDFLGLK